MNDEHSIPEKEEGRFAMLSRYISAQDIAQYLSLEKIKNVVIIIMATVAPIVFLVTQVQLVATQLTSLNADAALSQARKTCHEQAYAEHATDSEQYEFAYTVCVRTHGAE